MPRRKDGYAQQEWEFLHDPTRKMVFSEKVKWAEEQLAPVYAEGYEVYRYTIREKRPDNKLGKIIRPATPEQKKAKEIMRKKKMHDTNKERYALHNQSANQLSRRKGIMSGKTDNQKLQMILRNMLTTLIEDAAALQNVNDWANDRQQKMRRAQLSNIRDLMSVIKGLREMLADLYVQEEGSDKAPLLTAENVELLDEARKKLKKAGMKFDAGNTKPSDSETA
jgi:hypothetical protein